MIALDVADLVLIASRTLGLDTGRVLDLLDVAAAERALARARPGRPAGGPADQAAALLHALVRERPLRRGNQQVALAAMLQFLALNGWDTDPDPPEPVQAVIARLAAGVLGPGSVADWLAPRLRSADRPAPRVQEARMPRKPPLAEKIKMATMRVQPKGMFMRFTDRSRRAVHLAQEEARLLRHPSVGPEHLLLGLLYEGEGVAARVLESLGISREVVRSRVEEITGLGPVPPPATCRSPRRPSWRWSCRCARRCRSGTTTSVPNTSCWACSGGMRVSPPRCWPHSAPAMPGSRNGCLTCWAGSSRTGWASWPSRVTWWTWRKNSPGCGSRRSPRSTPVTSAAPPRCATGKRCF